MEHRGAIGNTFFSPNLISEKQMQAENCPARSIGECLGRRLVCPSLLLRECAFQNQCKVDDEVEPCELRELRELRERRRATKSEEPSRISHLASRHLRWRLWGPGGAPLKVTSSVECHPNHLRVDYVRT